MSGKDAKPDLDGGRARDTADAAEVPADRTRHVVDVYYVDGIDRADDLEVPLRPVSMVAAERHFKGTVPPAEGTMWAVHHHLCHERGLEATFGDWLADWVDDIDEREVPLGRRRPPKP